MKWRSTTNDDFNEDWMFSHYRYKSDHLKLDTDLFEIRDGALIKIGGTGRLPFYEVEILDESVQYDKVTPQEIGSAAGNHAHYFEKSNPSAHPKTCSFQGFYSGATWMQLIKQDFVKGILQWGISKYAVVRGNFVEYSVGIRAHGTDYYYEKLVEEHGITIDELIKKYNENDNTSNRVPT